MNKRIIALDVGDVRVGIAVSDPTGTIAQPLEVYRRVGYGPDSRHVKSLCDQYQTDIVLLGLPLNMDGSVGFQAQKVLDFSAQLEALGLQVYFQDERMTTIIAEDVLIQSNVQRKNRKKYVDKLAATVILEQWLNRQPNQSPQEECLP